MLTLINIGIAYLKWPNILVFGRQNCILYEPNHFLVNFLKCGFCSLGNQSTWSPNLTFFPRYFYWLHKTWFHSWWFHNWLLIMYFAYNLSFCSFSNYVSLLMSTSIRFEYLWSILNVGKTYSMGIKGCNP